MTEKVYDSDLEKEAPIHEVLIRLRDRLGVSGFELVDHWDADLHAVGIGRPGDNRYVAHISTWAMQKGRYYLSLDAPRANDSDSEIVEVERFDNIDFSTLLTHVGRHLKYEPSDGSDKAV